LFGVVVGSTGFFWLLIAELHHRRTLGARRRERLRTLYRGLVAALEAEEAKAHMDHLRSTCPNRAAFESAKSESIGRFAGPVYYTLGVDPAWQDEHYPAAAAEDAELADLGIRLQALIDFGLLGPLAAEKGRCVAVDSLEGEAAGLNGERGVVQSYDEAEDKYEVTFLLPDMGSVNVKCPTWSLTLMSDEDVLASIQAQQLAVLTSPEIQGVLHRLRSECSSQSIFLHRREGIDSHVLGPILTRHGVDAKWCGHMSTTLSSQNPEVEQRVRHIIDLLAFSPGNAQETTSPTTEEPQRWEAAPRAPARERSELKPHGQLYEVVGGGTEGLPVLGGSDEQGWTELPGRLRAGAVVTELARYNEYFYYRKLTGDGPAAGWITRPVEGNDPLVTTNKKPLEVWILCIGTRGDFQPFAALAQGLLRAGHAARVLGNENQGGFAAACGLPFTSICTDTESAIRAMIEQRDKASGFLEAMTLEDFDHELLMHEVEVGKPDMLVFSTLCEFWAMNVERKFGVPALAADLQPRGLEGTTPGFSEEAFLEASHRSWEALCHVEEVKVRPAYGVAALTDMGFERYHRRSHQEGHLVGFLASLCDFLHQLPPHVREVHQRHSYTGFWFLDSENSSRIVDGAESMEAVERFLAAGPAVYVGWGSCVCEKGPPHMVTLAVGALKEAGARGVVLGGWAGLSMQLLCEAVGPEDPFGLREYAWHNVLFVERVSHAWLFPKCICHVHHGGVGTLAASWQTGRPVIVTPIWLDQFGNAELVKYMCGLATPALDELNHFQLGGYIKRAMTDLGVAGTAKMLAQSVEQEDGVGEAVRYVSKFAKEELTSGKWHKRWKSTGYGWRKDWGMDKYV